MPIDRESLRLDEAWRNPGGFHRRPLATLGLSLVCLLVFLEQHVLHPTGGSPGGTAQASQLQHLFEFWRVVSCQFVHASWWHLITNLIGLLVFGRIVEERSGPLHVAGMFLLGGLVGVSAEIWANPAVTVSGASAGVFALMAAAGVCEPNRQLRLPFLPEFPLTLKYVAVSFFCINAFDVCLRLLQRGNPDAAQLLTGQVATLAHTMGAVTGFFYAHAMGTSFSENVRESERRRSRWMEEQRKRARQEREHSWVPAHAFNTREENQTEEAAVEAVVTPREYIAERVDPILEKISIHGQESLSPEERFILREAAARLTDEKGGTRPGRC